jgi:hypothetical protein
LQSKFWTKMMLLKKFMWCSTNILIEQIQNISCLQIFWESNDLMIQRSNCSILDIRDDFKSELCKLIFNNCASKTSIHESYSVYCYAYIFLFYSFWNYGRQFKLSISEQKGLKQTKIISLITFKSGASRCFVKL